MGVSLGIATSVVLSDASFGATRPLIVAFTIEQGAAGLQPGSLLTIGGFECGSVRRVEIETDPDTGAPVRLLAHARVRSSVKLFEGTRVLLESPLLGGVSSLNIVSVGSGTTQLTGTEVLVGAPALPRLLAQSGYGPDQANQVRAFIANIDAVAQQIRDFTADAAPSLNQQIDQMRTVVDNVQAIADDVRAQYPQWSENVSVTLANAEQSSQRLDAISANLEEGSAEAKSLMTDARATLADNREGLDNIVANVESATEKFDRETIDAINETLETFNADLKQVMAWIREEWPGLRKVVANLRLASDQLKMTMIEVRRAPWRLLYQPVRKELENELLYDSARTYAEAVSDLRSASESLEVLHVAVTKDPTASIDPKQIERISISLNQAFERYRKAEQDFLTRLIDDRDGKK